MRNHRCCREQTTPSRRGEGTQAKFWRAWKLSLEKLAVVFAPTLWDVGGAFFFLSQAGVVILDEQTLQNSKSRIWFPSWAFKLKDAVRQLGVIRYRHTDHKWTQELVQNVHICTCLTRLRHKFSVKGKYSVIHQTRSAPCWICLGPLLSSPTALLKGHRTASQAHESVVGHGMEVIPP